MHCGILARPSILMFGDNEYVHDSVSGQFFDTWMRSVKKALKDDPNKKIVIVEIGCGVRIKTVRYKTESVCKEIGEQCTLVRINPEFPLKESPEYEINYIQILNTGLNAVKRINYYLENDNLENDKIEI